jgi:hypothetical protein
VRTSCETRSAARRNVDQAAAESGDRKFDALTERVQVALGERAGGAQEGLPALGVGIGLGVLTELMAEQVDDVLGPKGRSDGERDVVAVGDTAVERRKARHAPGDRRRRRCPAVGHRLADVALSAGERRGERSDAGAVEPHEPVGEVSRVRLLAGAPVVITPEERGGEITRLPSLL